VPASRSRTERWRDCLRQVYERDGALEVSVPAPRTREGSTPSASALPPSTPSDLIWRVRILDLREDRIVVEQPSAAGQWIELAPGTGIIAALSIGQNRWMFRTTVLQPRERAARSVTLEMPEFVERCQRRSFFRVSAAELSLPTVDCWPLLDPTTVIAAEVANRAQILDLIQSPRAIDAGEEPLILPEVGPRFGARLMNLGGGGIGLMIDRTAAGALDKARMFWLRVNLMPQIPAPLGLTARMVHTHIDSSQNIYAGLAFEWSYHQSHREFVVQQITRYVRILQARGAPVM
jgi:hypothetical protein